jgi:phytoene dehydrogenase-like protein
MPEFPPARPAPTVHGDWSPEGFVPLARDVYGVPESLLGDYAKVLERIAGATREQIDQNVEVTLGDWVKEHVERPELQRAVLMMAKTIYCQYPERASAGRIMGFFSQRHAGEPILHGFADDEEAGGMQGAIAPFERAFRARGGQVILGHKPLEVLIEDGRAVGVLAVNPSHLALEIRAPHVIMSYPIWAALPLIPPAHVDPQLTRIARGLEDSGTDGIGLQIALRRLPRLRSSGEVETHRGWNRMFIGAERHFRGGWHIASMSSHRVAPPGRHLLHCLITRWLRRDERLWWAETRAWADAARAYLGTFYADLDECVEWQSYQYMARPGMMGWFWAPVRRHGIRAPGVRNLYFANTTIESEASPVDISAQAGLEAARAVLQDR